MPARRMATSFSPNSTAGRLPPRYWRSTAASHTSPARAPSPKGRRNGAQLALLDARMRHAAAHGCDLALMGAAPGSGSQRNAERHGFRIAYTASSGA
jgi:hypothetical protein